MVLKVPARVEERCDDVTNACLNGSPPGVRVLRRYSEGERALVLELQGLEIWRAAATDEGWVEAWSDEVRRYRPEVIEDADKRTASRATRRRS